VLGTALSLAAMRSHRAANAPIAMAFAKHQQPVTSTGEFVAMPDLSPDGRYLAYSTATGIDVRDHKGGMAWVSRFTLDVMP
jgi:hypothetical protein